MHLARRSAAKAGEVTVVDIATVRRVQVVAGRLARRPAGRTTARLVLQATAGIELLLTGSECELGATVVAGQDLVGESQLYLPFNDLRASNKTWCTTAVIPSHRIAQVTVLLDTPRNGVDYPAILAQNQGHYKQLPSGMAIANRSLAASLCNVKVV